MSNNLYVTATEARSGKSAIILGVMQMIIKEISSIAFFRPIIGDHVFGRVDHDVNLILKYFKLQIPYNDTHAYTLSQARQLITSGQEELLYENIPRNTSSWPQSTTLCCARARTTAARTRASSLT